MAVLVPCCNECEAPATPATPMSTCSRCQVVLYCSRAHQQADFSGHKMLCRRAKECYDLLAREERELRALPADETLPENVFEEGVGIFWLLEPTRAYMRAKYEIVRTMSVLNTHAAMERGLAECWDALRLCRGDNIAIREVMPVMMLSLGRFQEAYDFIKWYATADPDGTYEWSNPAAPFLTVKNADMTEPIACFEKESSVFFLGALTFIKVTLALALSNALDTITAMDQQFSDEVAESLVALFGSSATGVPRKDGETKTLLKTLMDQAEAAFKLVHARNANYWPAMLNPMPLVQEPDPGYYAFGDRFQIKIWVMPNAYLWSNVPDFIEENLKNV